MGGFWGVAGAEVGEDQSLSLGFGGHLGGHGGGGMLRAAGQL
jgi:hypothetical protein